MAYMFLLQLIIYSHRNVGYWRNKEAVRCVILTILQSPGNILWAFKTSDWLAAWMNAWISKCIHKPSEVGN